MNKKWTMVALLLSSAALASAQTMPDAQTSMPPSAQQQPSAQPPADAAPNPAAKPQADSAQPRANLPAIPVTLDKSVDSKKAKSGDEIVAKLGVPLNDAKGTNIPVGTKVIGHVTDAKAKSKGDPQSSLSFAFDKFVLKNGQDIPFKAVAQAIGPAQTGSPTMVGGENPGAASPQSGSGASNGPSQAGPANGGGGASGRPSPDMNGNGANAGAAGSSGRLPENSTGAVGMKGVTLNSQADSTVVSSDSKSLKLDSGTQMLLKVIQQ